MRVLQQYGYYGVNYQLIGAEPASLTELKDRLLIDPVRYTGWGPFWFPTRPEIAPRVINETTYECIHDSDDTRQIEKWRVTTDGYFTIVRAHDLDQYDEPGRYINLILPVWRIAELLLHAGRMGQVFSADEVEFTALFTGLRDRELTTKETPGRFLVRDYQTGANDYQKAIAIPVADIDRQVIEYTDKLLRPFYELFEFVLPDRLVEEEINRMRSGQF